MSTLESDVTQTILSQMLAQHGLTGKSRLFRVAERDSLVPTGVSGRYRLPANPDPAESVIDIYGPGYLVQAGEVGAGLAFADTPSNNWQESVVLRAIRNIEDIPKGPGESQVEVEVQLDEILRQGGLMYPVESVEVARAWYFTLPSGSVEVRLVE
jgi:hypothetical protein